MAVAPGVARDTRERARVCVRVCERRRLPLEIAEGAMAFPVAAILSCDPSAWPLIAEGKARRISIGDPCPSAKKLAWVLVFPGRMLGYRGRYGSAPEALRLIRKGSRKGFVP